jgi:magnesium-transporting ATPase (P-type)
MQVLAIDLGTDMLPAIALGTEPAEPGTMARPPRRRAERLLDRAVLLRVFGWIGPLEGLAAMTSFLFAYWLGGWRPWEPLAATGARYEEATMMTMAGIVMAQVGAGLAWRTTRRPLAAVGVFSNRLLLVAIGVEVAMIALLAYTPGLGKVFHTGALGAWEWLLLLAWPVLVLGADEARKAFARRQRPVLP